MDFDKAIQIKSDFAEAYNNRGAAYIEKGNYDKAIQNFDKVIQIEPNNAEVYSNRGVAYDGKDEFDTF